MKSKSFTTTELARYVEARLVGDGNLTVTRVNALDAAGPTDVSFITSEKFAEKALTTKAAAILTKTQIKTSAPAQIIVADVQTALIKLLHMFAPEFEVIEGIHPTAVVHESAKLADHVAVGPNAVIDKNVTIGENTVIGPGCSIGEAASIGSNCRLDSNTVVYYGCKIGNNCIIKANATIGGAGFGYYFIDGAHRHIPHNGSVIIEDFVDIGSNTCIDRAKFGNTIVKAGTKIDNVVQIAHNCEIGRCCIIAGCAGMAGSVKVGDGAVLGGQVGVIDNITIGPGARIAANTLVRSDLQAGKNYLGDPAQEVNVSMRQRVAVKKLPGMLQEFKELAKRVEKLESAKNN